MKLDDFRKAKGLTYSDLAELLGARNTNAAWRWCQGAAPERITAARISAATDGLVTIEELLYPDGLPAGAIVAREPSEDDAAGTTVGAHASEDAPAASGGHA